MTIILCRMPCEPVLASGALLMPSCQWPPNLTEEDPVPVVALESAPPQYGVLAWPLLTLVFIYLSTAQIDGCRCTRVSSFCQRRVCARWSRNTRTHVFLTLAFSRTGFHFRRTVILCVCSENFDNIWGKLILCKDKATFFSFTFKGKLCIQVGKKIVWQKK